MMVMVMVMKASEEYFNPFDRLKNVKGKSGTEKFTLIFAKKKFITKIIF
jgi:hypothetical protein